MTRHLFLDGDIETGMVRAFTSELDKAASDGVDLVVFLSSPGGHLSDADVLTRVINDFPGGLRIVVSWEAVSCAFTMLLGMNREVRFLDHAFARIHTVSRIVETRNLVDPEGIDRFLQVGVDRRNQQIESLLKPYLSGKQLRIFRSGGWVNFDAARAEMIVLNCQKLTGGWPHR